MSSAKNAVSSVLVTCFICLVSALLITLCVQVTADNIEANRQKKADELRLELLPDADEFQVLEDIELVQGVEEVCQAANKAGWVITSKAKGYQGWVTVMTGINKSGRITSVKVTDVSEESAGIGTKLTKQSYLDQYKGVSSISSYKGKINANYIEAVSGATYTSEAVYSCVSLALMQVKELEARSGENELNEQKQ